MIRVLKTECEKLWLFNVNVSGSQIEAGAVYIEGHLPSVMSFDDDVKIELAEAFQKVHTTAFEVNVVFNRVYG